MKKTLVIILIIFLIILAIVSYYVYNTRRIETLAKQMNKTYEPYKDTEILGTTLISLINKAVDDNEKNEVKKLENSILYEDNGKDSIIITVKFLLQDEIVRMEQMAEKSSESFVSAFSSAYFKCTNIEYHKETGQVKSMYFEEIDQNKN